jgi:hypothetical protein
VALLPGSSVLMNQAARKLEVLCLDGRSFCISELASATLVFFKPFDYPRI